MLETPSLTWIGMAPILTIAASPCISRTHSSQVNLVKSANGFGRREGNYKKANNNLLVRYWRQIYTYNLFCLSPSLRSSEDSSNEGKEEKTNLHLWRGWTLGYYWTRIWSRCSTHLLRRLLYCEPNIISMGEYMRVRLPYIKQWNRNVDLRSHTSQCIFLPGLFDFLEYRDKKLFLSVP